MLLIHSLIIKIVSMDFLHRENLFAADSIKIAKIYISRVDECVLFRQPFIAREHFAI